jgi:hypothetical protein
MIRLRRRLKNFTNKTFIPHRNGIVDDKFLAHQLDFTIGAEQHSTDEI